MSDLIDRKALIAEYDRVHIGPPGGARKLMEDAPAVDAVEVVRCKDCKHYNEDALACNLLSWVNSSEHENWYADDFCSYGERRNDEGN